MKTIITYKNLGIAVYLDGKLIGHIKEVEDGFAYFPKGKKYCGEIFPDVDSVKKSL